MKASYPILLGILITLIFPRISRAQSQQFELGIQMGPGLANMRGNEVITNLQDPTLGLSGGLYFRYSPEKLKIQTGINFERKGSQYDAVYTDNLGNILAQGISYTYADYLTIPLLAGYYFGEKQYFYVQAGPYLGYLMQLTYVHTGDLPFGNSDDTDSFKRMDVGFSTGAGIRFPIGPKFTCSFEIRNNLGLLNMSKGPVYNNGSIKNNLTLGLFGFGYQF